MLVFILASLISSFLVSFAVTAVMRKLAPRWRLVDHPAVRKIHYEAKPLGGGIGIWLGVVIPVILAQLVAWWAAGAEPSSAWFLEGIPIHWPGLLARSGQMWAILAGGTILVILGLLDDLKGLPWPPRLAVQMCVTLGLALAGVQATLFVPLPWVGTAVTVLWILVLVNAFNFLDNMDGLSAGIGLVASVLFAAVMLTATGEPRWLVGGVMLVLSGSLTGFLCHNWPPARIFMGDSGSYFLGFLMATMTVLGTFYEPEVGSRHVMLAPLCILAVPLYDFSSVIVIRLLEGRSLFHPDKSHFSHRLVELGLHPRHAVLTVHLATLTTGLAALLLYRLAGWLDALLVIALVACILAIVAILETAGRK